MTRQAVTFRLPVDLVEWLRHEVPDRAQTALVERLLRAKKESRLLFTEETLPNSEETARNLLAALHERRLIITSEPAPHAVCTGSAESPAPVCLDPQ